MHDDAAPAASKKTSGRSLLVGEEAMSTETMTAVVRSFGTSLAIAERYWQESKGDVRCALGWVKELLGLDSEQLTLSGWPVREVLEAEEEEAPDAIQSYTFDIDKVEGDDRGKLMKALKEKDFTVIWELLKGQVICIPGLTEDDHDKLEDVLKKYKLKTKPVKETVEPLLTGLCLLEFYRVHELQKTSRVVNEDGSAKLDTLTEEMLLLESSVSYKKWLIALFPNCDMEYVNFLAEQPPKA